MIYVCIPTTKERRPRLQKCIDALRLNTKYPIAICTYENEEGCTDVGWVTAIHKLLEGINGLVFILGDDAIPDPDCIERLYDTYKMLDNKEEWVLQPFEQYHQGELATFPFCHSDILKKYIFKGYKHLWSDTELTQIMRAKGRFGRVHGAYVDHQHYISDKKLFDETYEKSLKMNDADKQLFQERKAAGFLPHNEI